MIDEESLDRLITLELDKDSMLCPFCCANFIDPGTKAADRYGVCEVCYTKALASATESKIRIDQAHREYNSAKQRLCRFRKANGIKADNARTEPIFDA